MKNCIATYNLSFRNQIRYPDIMISRETITFISGVSGCGKSSLFRLLNGTASPSSGSVWYEGEDLAEMDKIMLRRKVLLVNQVPYLFRGSVRENFRIYHGYHETPCPKLEEIERLLLLCCLSQSPEESCDTMSGGERQRVFLSIALSLMPEVFLLDEPTSALNYELSSEVMKNLIACMKEQRRTMLVVSHDAALQSAYAERIVELGRVL